jgi:hypothetical protein
MHFNLVQEREGFALSTCTPRISHYTPIGAVFDGLADALLDSCTSCVARTLPC